MNRLLTRSLLVVAVFLEASRASALSEPSVGVDFGAGGGPGLGGLSVRLQLADPLFIEAFGGYGLSGPQVGGGVGWSLADVPLRGTDPMRFSAIASYSVGFQQTTNTYRELLPIPAPYAGRYHWLNAGFELELPLAVLGALYSSPTSVQAMFVGDSSAAAPRAQQAESGWVFGVSMGLLGRLAFDPAPSTVSVFREDEMPPPIGPFVRMRLAYRF